MTCALARQALAVADLRDLANGADDLAAHLRGCPECRAQRDAVVAQTALLRALVRGRSRRRRTRRFMLAAGVPIAAAAVFAVSFRDRHALVPAVRSTGALPVARRVSVTVGPGQSAAVLRTADTTVTVIWLTGAGQ